MSDTENTTLRKTPTVCMARKYSPRQDCVTWCGRRTSSVEKLLFTVEGIDEDSTCLECVQAFYTSNPLQRTIDANQAAEALDREPPTVCIARNYSLGEHVASCATWCGRTLFPTGEEIACSVEDIGKALACPECVQAGAVSIAQRMLDTTPTCLLKKHSAHGKIVTWCGKVLRLHERGLFTEDVRSMTCDSCTEASISADKDILEGKVRPPAVRDSPPTTVEGFIQAYQDLKESGKLERLMWVPGISETQASKADTLKIEDGDWVLLRTRSDRLGRLADDIRIMRDTLKEMGIDAKVLHLPEGYDVSVVKKAELGDLHQRLEDLESRVQSLDSELDDFKLSMGQ